MDFDQNLILKALLDLYVQVMAKMAYFKTF